jgi:hypothetical protein
MNRAGAKGRCRQSNEESGARMVKRVKMKMKGEK